MQVQVPDNACHFGTFMNCLPINSSNDPTHLHPTAAGNHAIVML